MQRQIPLIVLILVFFIGQVRAQVIWQKLNLPEPKIIGIQASPNGKLFLFGKNSLYVSSNEGDSWDAIGTYPTRFNVTYPVRFNIDSQGVLYGLRDRDSILFTSFDEGVTWSQTTINIPILWDFPTQFIIAQADSLFLFTWGPTVYRSIDSGKTWIFIGTSSHGDFYWLGGGITSSGLIYAVTDPVYNYIEFVTQQFTSPKILGKTKCIADNSPPYNFSFDHSTYGFFMQLCTLFRSSDNGETWNVIDSLNSNSGRYLPPYAALEKGGLVAVSDTSTVISMDHSNTWQKIGKGINGYITAFFVDRKGFVYANTDSSIYRMSLFASVHSSPSATEDIIIHFNSTQNQITLQSGSPLGLTTASLYTIDGRLLTRTKLDISAAGIYTLDVSDQHTRFALLVLQTEKGVITQKVLIY